MSTIIRASRADSSCEALHCRRPDDFGHGERAALGGCCDDSGRRMSKRAIEVVAALALACALLGASGCSAPPALTKAQLDSRKMSQHHPKIADAQKQNCRGCHREAPPIKQQP